MYPIQSAQTYGWETRLRADMPLARHLRHVSESVGIAAIVEPELLKFPSKTYGAGSWTRTKKQSF